MRSASESANYLRKGLLSKGSLSHSNQPQSLEIFQYYFGISLWLREAPLPQGMLVPPCEESRKCNENRVTAPELPGRNNKKVPRVSFNRDVPECKLQKTAIYLFTL